MANSCAKTNIMYVVYSLYVNEIQCSNCCWIATPFTKTLPSIKTCNYCIVYFAGPLNNQYSLDGTSTECARTCPGKWLTLIYTILGTQHPNSFLKTIKTTYVSLAKGYNVSINKNRRSCGILDYHPGCQGILIISLSSSSERIQLRNKSRMKYTFLLPHKSWGETYFSLGLKDCLLAQMITCRGQLELQIWAGLLVRPTWTPVLGYLDH